MKPLHSLPPSGITSYLDFKQLFNQWELLADKKKPETCLYHELLNRIQKFPDLNQTPVNPLDLEKDENKLGFGLILSSLFPLSGQEQKKIFGLSTPFNFNPIYATSSFKDQFLDEDGQVILPDNLTPEVVTKHNLLYMYQVILDQVYGIKINPIHPLVFKVKGKNGLTRHFQIQLDTQFVKVIPKCSLPEFHSLDAVCSRMSPSVNDLEKWREQLPIEQFEFYGFVLQEAQDITITQSIASLNQAVLNQDQSSPEDFLQIVKDSIRSMLGRSDLKIGLVVLQSIQNRLVLTESRLSNSFLIRQLCGSACQEQFQAIKEFLSQVKTPIFLNDIGSLETAIPMSNQMADFGIKSAILYPLRHNGTLVGVLEVCSLNESSFDPTTLLSLDYLAPSLSLALYRQAEILDQKIKGIIRKNFTAIHPVVEWKFDEIALDYALEEEEGRISEIKPIVFRDVYPLYGAVDVKDSSRQRNHAIHNDFGIQLAMGKRILEQAKSLHFLPLLDRLLDKIEEFESRIVLMMLGEEEVRITEFFHRELEPVFLHLSETFEELELPVKAYFDALDEELKVVNRNRKDFEQSLEEINQTIGSYLDLEEAKIQDMFPHYFEKFKTDGLEYNIYIGQSLVKDKKFDPLYLRNLRLWQLQTLIEIVHLVQAKSKNLPLQLETTQMILAHSVPISISFRLDERKFDVEGAYNIRYEVIKKRIDKALIKGTKNRLAQPGKIAIVYSQQRDAQDYGDFISFLQNKGLLEEEVEYLELEEMQGVNGMKALRVSVIPSINDDSSSGLKAKLKTERREG